MGYLEQENRVLREEMTAMQTKMDEMPEVMKTMAEAPSPPPPVRTQAETSASAAASAAPEWSICADTPIHSAPQRSAPRFSPFTAEASNSMPEGRPWGVPVCLSEVFCPIIFEAPMPTPQNAAHVRAPPAAMTYSAPVMHTIPQDEEPIYHSWDMEAY
jgi:hypothetical protein